MSFTGACAKRSAAAAAILLTSTVAYADGPSRRPVYAPTTSSAASMVYFSGFDSAKDADYMYQGAILALNRDIGRDGFVLRAYGSKVDYEYLNGATPTAGDGWQGDLMIGYKASAGRVWAAGYIGVDYQDFKTTPDDLAGRPRGSEVGFKVAGDVATLRNEGPLYFSLSGNYSTAFDSYWVRGRVGANLHRITIGPEYVRMGNVGFDASRVGGFVTFDLPLIPKMPLETTLSIGHQSVDGNSNGSGGGDGTYVGVAFTSVF